MIETKVRILDAAERLFAQQGLDVSIRAITDEAGVNLSAVNYHFQSKDALMDAVIARRVEPISRRRLEMLDAVEVRSAGGPPLEGVLEAFLAPILEPTGPGLEHLRPLIGKLYSMPDEFVKRVFSVHLAPVAARFTNALGRALPGLSEAERLWRLHFTVGAMVHVMNWSGVIPALSNGLVDPSDTKALLQRIIEFCAAGFRAPHKEEAHV